MQASRAAVRAVAVAALALLGAAPLVAQPAGSAATVTAIGPDAAACAQGSSALRVRVTGFKDRAGLLRVSTYVATKDAWLVPGKFLRRIDMPVPQSGDVDVCVALSGAGRYGVAVLHDRNGDHHASIWSDGGGYSNGAAVGLSKPAVDRVAFVAGPGVTTVNIVLKYL